MAFQRPTLQQLITRQQTDIESRLPGTDPRLRRSALYALVRSVAGGMHCLYGYIAWMACQVVPSTAESEYLEGHASWWGVTRKAAAAATGSVTFTGTDGSVIHVGTTLQRSDGTEYTTDFEGAISGDSVDIAVTAVEGGQDTNADTGVTLSLVSPIAGVESSATVATGGLTGGADTESDDDLRERLQARVQNPPHGGSEADYEAWMLEVSGVTRAWVMPQWLGGGTVAGFFVRDDDDSIIPDAAEVQAVQDHVDTKRPVTADFSALAPVAAPQDMTISLSPNTTSVRDAVQSELTDLFRREAHVEDGNGSGAIPLSHVRAAISTAAGEQDHTVSLATDIAVAAGEIATLGTLTFQDL